MGYEEYIPLADEMGGQPPLAEEAFLEEASPAVSSPMNTDVKLSEEEQKKIVRMVSEDYERDKAESQDWRDDLRKYWDAYRGRVGQKDFPWPNCSNMHPPVEGIMIDAFLPRAYEAIFGSDTLIYAVPRNEVAADRSEAITSFLDWQLKEQTDVRKEWDDGILTACVEGTLIGKVTWQRDYDAEGKCVFSGPQVKCSSAEDFFAPATAQGVKVGESPYVIHRYWEDVNELAAQQGKDGTELYTIDDDVRNTVRMHRPQEESEKKADEQEDVGRREIGQNPRINDILVLEGHYRYTAPGEKHPQNWIFWVGYASRKLIRYCRWDRRRRPFFSAEILPKPGVFGGAGFCEKLAPASALLSTMYNQHIDMRTMMLLNIWVARPEVKEQIDRQKKQMYPGAIWECDDPEGLKKLIDPRFDPGFTPEINAIWKYCEQLMGVSDYTLGRESETNKRPTKGGTEALIAEGNVRWDRIIDRLKNEAFVDMCEIILELDATELADEGVKFRVCGAAADKFDSPYITITRETLESHEDLILKTTSVNTNRQTRKQEAVEWAGFLLSQPNIQQNPVAVYKIDEFVSQRFGNMNFREIVPPPPQAQDFPLQGPGTLPETEVAAMAQGQEVDSYEEGPAIQMHLESHNKWAVSQRGQELLKDPGFHNRFMAHLQKTNVHFQQFQEQQQFAAALQAAAMGQGGQPMGQAPSGFGPPPAPQIQGGMWPGGMA